MNYLEYALEKKKSNPDIEIYGGVSMELIKSVEQQLQIVFPKEYKAFLLECGSCSIYDTHISGLFKSWDNSKSTGSTLHDTLDARTIYGLPQKFIVLEYCIDENLYVLSIPQSDNEDSKVYSVDIDIENKLSQFNEIFSSFEEYFKFSLD